MISVTILTKNSAKTLEATLHSVACFPEVVVFDTGSTDQTVEIARRFSNVTIFQGSFEGFGKTHNKASSLARFDTILSLDSDEVLSLELAKEILNLLFDPNTIYLILRKNYLHGRHITGCAGWHPDFVCRLYNRTITCFDDAEVHEKIIQGSLQKKKLQFSMSHTPYLEIGDFLNKMQSYSSLFAKQHCGKKKSSAWSALAHGFAAFFKSYILKKGCLLGAEGLIISIYNGHTAFYKYLKLAEANGAFKIPFSKTCGGQDLEKKP